MENEQRPQQYGEYLIPILSRLRDQMSRLRTEIAKLQKDEKLIREDLEKLVAALGDLKEEMTEPLATIVAELVRMVRAALHENPTPRNLRRALNRAIIATGDELTRTMTERCNDAAYARSFGMAVLRSEK
jgi:predicted  nucleic acid-binding Zn-ribbon protein